MCELFFLLVYDRKFLMVVLNNYLTSELVLLHMLRVTLCYFWLHNYILNILLFFMPAYPAVMLWEISLHMKHLPLEVLTVSEVMRKVPWGLVDHMWLEVEKCQFAW